jgi:ATP-dependent helicase HrpA
VSRELFIRHGLTEGDMQTRAPFWRHNQSLIADLHALEAKERRRDLLVDEEVIFGFYAKRIPDGIYSVAQLESWLRELPASQRKLLHMRTADIVKTAPDAQQAERFPDVLALNESRLPLSYRFAPGEADDGVTLSVPVSMIGQVTPGIADRLVPGLLREKLTALIKGLPKSLRRQLVPVPDVVERCLAVLPESDAPLVQTLGQVLKDSLGVTVPEDAWRPEQLPDHLRLRIRLLDAAGKKTLAVSRDIATLHRDFSGRAGATPPADDDAEPGMTAWECGALPRESEHQAGRLRMRVYPALVDCGDHVEVRRLDSLASAQRAHHAGVRRLLMLVEARSIRALKKNIRDLQAMRLHYAGAPPAPFGEQDAQLPELAEQLVALACDRAFLDDAWTIRSAEAFEQCRRDGRSRLGPALLEIGELVSGILERAHRARAGLAQMPQEQWRASVADMREQLQRLVYQGFLQDIAPAQLAHLPRYLDALLRRIERLPLDARRDAVRLEEFADLQRDWVERRTALAARGQYDERLEEIRWLLEELRVSLFAQELKTVQPVSVKRIRRRWEALGL